MGDEEAEAAIRQRLTRKERAEQRRASDMVRDGAQAVVAFFTGWGDDANPLTEGGAPAPLGIQTKRMPMTTAERLNGMSKPMRDEILAALVRDKVPPENVEAYVRNMEAYVRNMEMVAQSRLSEEANDFLMREVTKLVAGATPREAAYMAFQKAPGIYSEEDDVDRDEIERMEARVKADLAALDKPKRVPTLDSAESAAQEIIARQRRLQDEEWCARFPEQAADDRRKEQSRLNVAGVLSQAVATGLITEDRAVAMIAVGGLNDRDLTEAMDDDDAMAMMTTIIQQGVRSGLFPRERAEKAMAALGMIEEPPPDKLTAATVRNAVKYLRKTEEQREYERLQALQGGAPDGLSYMAVGQGLAGKDAPPGNPEPIYDEDELAELQALALNNWPVDGDRVDERAVAKLVKAVPRLVTSVYRLVEAAYEAATIEPCHSPPHGQLHQGQGTCEYQYAGVGQRLIKAIGLESRFLPRRKHYTDGQVAQCCLRDGNTGTWVKYGQSINPGLTPSRVDEGSRSEVRVYTKSDGKVYSKAEGGTERLVAEAYFGGQGPNSGFDAGIRQSFVSKALDDDEDDRPGVLDRYDDDIDLEELPF